MANTDIHSESRFFAVSTADSLDEREFRFLMDIASPERRAKASRLIMRQDAARALVAEALVRYSIRSIGKDQANGLSFRYNEFGKPFLNGVNLEFNLSHSGGWVICATSPDMIGVDIERHSPTDLGIAKRFFNRSEIQLLDEVQEIGERLNLFFDIWALKESYIKAIGTGLSCPLDGFACLPGRSGSEVEFRSNDANLPLMHFQLIRGMPGYSCSACLANEEKQMIPVIISPSELVAGLRNDGIISPLKRGLPPPGGNPDRSGEGGSAG